MFDEITLRLAPHKNKILIFLAAIAILDFFIFQAIVSASAGEDDLKIYFLDVGQGDSELIVLPGGAKILIDGGPADGKILSALAKILPPTDRYIDLAMMSHPQLDHFGGLIDVLKRYRVGAFLANGRKGTAKAFSDLEHTIEAKSVPTALLAAGDKIRYRDSVLTVLSPTPYLLASKELNDTTIVAELESKNSKILFTGDIGANVEEDIIKTYRSDIDFLKVAHHGSRFSSSAGFLSVVKPEVAVIEVGKNIYGHPTAEALERLGKAGAAVFRTDRDGTIELTIDGKKARIFRK